MDVDAVGGIGEVVAEFIGFAPGHAWFHASAGHEDGEAARVVIAAVIVLGQGALRVGGASEFPAPDDQGIIEQAALFEVGDEGGAGLVGVAALSAVCFWQSAVMIPAHVKQLHEPDIAFGQSSSEQAVGGIRARSLHIRAVHVENRLRFV